MNDELSYGELRRLDLTLLLIFLGLLKHQKAVLVAEELGLSRSAISQALARLRDIFGDELFLRHSHGLSPTALALGLEAPIQHAVGSLRGALGAATAFDPVTATGTVRIGAGDVEQVVLIPALVEHLYRLAPNLHLEILSLPAQDVAKLLTDGQVDLVLAEQGFSSGQICETELYRESWRAVCPPDVIDDRGEIPMQTYMRIPHIAINAGAEIANAPYCVGLTVSSYQAALAIASRVGGIATIPARLAYLFAEGFGLGSAPAGMRHLNLWFRRIGTREINAMRVVYG